MRPFVKRDLDGFCGLFVDNLVQILTIVFLCKTVVQLPDVLIFQRILPGAAISIIVGNLFYAFQAHRLAKRTGRDDVTALPYGINTPSLLVFIFFVMAPAYEQTRDPEYAWRMGLLACLGSGIIEFLGAFIAEKVRRSTPRAALLATLAGIAIGFISMTFMLQIFTKPLIALVPFAIVFLGYFGRIRLPLGMPSGMLALMVGTALAWLMTALQLVPSIPGWVTFGAMNPAAVTSSLHVEWSPPVWCGPDLMAVLSDTARWLPFLSVIVPMGLFNVIGSLQNIESAEAAGDSYKAAPSMVVNGIGTIAAAFLGSCFPTTIYIGHPGWKEMGARSGYSTLNGIVIVALALSGLTSLVAAIVPIEAGAAIVLWIGMIITAQAFNASPASHAPAVAIGLFPAIAAWGATIMLGTIQVSGGTTLQQILVPAATTPPATAPADETSTEANSDDLTPTVATPAPSDAATEEPPLTAESTTDSNATETEEQEPSPATPPPAPARPTADVNGFLVHGLLLMERGYIFTCMILAAVCACLVDRRFKMAAIWMFVAAFLTAAGVMHAYQVYGGNSFDYLFRFVPAEDGAFTYRADELWIAYLLCGILLLLISRGHHGTAANDETALGH